MSPRCLSVHAGYECRHSGECCSGVFPIPAEPHAIELGRRLAVGSQIPVVSETGDSRADSSGDAATMRQFLPKAADGSCAFFEPESRLCTLHRQGGEAALPTACRHFPRVLLRDDRGISLSLSHFCPTAAGLLLDDGPLEIVEASAPLALDGNVEAFEAAGTLPPLLHPRLLTDLDGFDAWERAAVGVLARDRLSCGEAIAIVAAATERTRRWAPGAATLAHRVDEAFGSPAMPAASYLDDDARLDLVAAARPGDRGRPAVRPREDTWERLVAPMWDRYDRPARRYLAAKLFGNRIAYECFGLRSIVEWVRVCLAVLRNEAALAAERAGVVLDDDLFIEAIRTADLTLVHRVDTAAIARGLLRIEQRP